MISRRKIVLTTLATMLLAGCNTRTQPEPGDLRVSNESDSVFTASVTAHRYEQPVDRSAVVPENQTAPRVDPVSEQTVEHTLDAGESVIERNFIERSGDYFFQVFVDNDVIRTNWAEFYETEDGIGGGWLGVRVRGPNDASIGTAHDQ